MKTINGNNKLERLINKSKKYLGIDLVKQSNKFLQVENKTYSNDIFVISTNQTYNSKNGEWLIIKPLNWKLEKPIFVKKFSSMKLDNWFTSGITIFKLNFDYVTEEVKTELEECLKGYDDLFTLNEWLKNNKIFVPKSEKDENVIGYVWEGNKVQKLKWQ